MNRAIIAFTGRAGSGKSISAKHLIRRFNANRVRFAGPLKSMLHAIGLDSRHTDGELKERPCDVLCGQTPRWAMQTLGNEWGRELIGQDLWVNAWKSQVRQWSDSRLIVVDDLRYENERDAVRSFGGIVIRVARMGEIAESDHPSETGDFEVDHGVIAGSVSVLLDEVEQIAVRYLRDWSWSRWDLPPMQEQGR